MNGRQTAIPPDDYVGRQAENPAASAIAPVIVADQPEVLGKREIEVYGTTKAMVRVLVGIQRMVNPESAEHACNLQMRAAARVECNLRNNVRMHTGCRER